jgi:hypothetical protein
VVENPVPPILEAACWFELYCWAKARFYLASIYAAACIFLAASSASFCLRHYILCLGVMPGGSKGSFLLAYYCPGKGRLLDFAASKLALA